MFIKLKSRIFFWLVIAAAGLILILLSSFFRGRPSETNQPPPGQLTASSSPEAAATAPKAATGSPQATKLPRPTVGSGSLPTPVPRGLITGPATCQLSGSINFISENLYETRGAKIAYQNVDDGSRFIFWKVSPDDGILTVGPNIFSQLTLPNGEREIGVSLTKPSSVESYTLTASVTYGVIKPNGSEEIKESACSGSIAVIMPVTN